jgi:hypothetical protein
MPTAPCRTVLVAAVLVAAVLAVLAVTAGGCSLGSGDDDEPTAPAAPSYAAAPDVVAGIQQALDRRARAVLDADAGAFARTVAGPPDFRQQQATWLGNLRQLPLGELSYTIDPAQLVRDGDDYWVVVQEHLLLEGYDAVPVVSLDRYRFRPGAKRPDRMLLTSVSDVEWEAAHEVRPQPWDLGPVQVRSGAGVLGIFDDGSVAASGRLVRSVERGLDQVGAVVPYEWSRTVVVYALSDPAYLAGIPDVPGGDPDELDGVAFPVSAAPGNQTLAATRFALHPDMLDRPGPARDRLVRHELTHVALGSRDDGAPVWLSEGLAEYVAARPMSPADRRVPAAAVRAAQAGFTDLPDDAAFNDPADDAATDTHYALAWWACEYLARSLGEPVLWDLLDLVGAGGVDVAGTLRDNVGLWPGKLAERAGDLIVQEYGPSPAGPEPPATTAPPTPTTPTTPPAPTDSSVPTAPVTPSSS